MKSHIVNVWQPHQLPALKFSALPVPACFLSDEKQHEQPTIHLQEFDNEEKERICSLHLREELFLVVFFIFTLRQIAKELDTMVVSFHELLEKRGNRKSLYMPKPISKRWLLKYIFISNYQSTRDKGGYTHGKLILQVILQSMTHASCYCSFFGALSTT